MIRTVQSVRLVKPIYFKISTNENLIEMRSRIQSQTHEIYHFKTFTDNLLPNIFHILPLVKHIFYR